jgi:hypothetical protein
MQKLITARNSRGLFLCKHPTLNHKLYVIELRLIYAQNQILAVVQFPPVNIVISQLYQLLSRNAVVS